MQFKIIIIIITNIWHLKMDFLYCYFSNFQKIKIAKFIKIIIFIFWILIKNFYYSSCSIDIFPFHLTSIFLFICLMKKKLFIFFLTLQIINKVQTYLLCLYGGRDGIFVIIQSFHTRTICNSIIFYIRIFMGSVKDL